MAEGDDWTTEENDRLVAMYFGLLERDILRIANAESPRVLNKAQAYRDFGVRSTKAVEWKMRNVTAILEDLGLPWISGLLPAENIQQGLTAAVWRYLAAGRENLPILPPQRKLLDLVPAPIPERGNQRIPEHLQSLIRKYDPAKRDDENRKLGVAGEELVFEMERRRLARENSKRLPDLKWVARDEGDGHGFDIRSFDDRGEELLIEVKTTRGAVRTPFFLTRNERKVAEDRHEAYRIFRVSNTTGRRSSSPSDRPSSRQLFWRPTSTRPASGWTESALRGGGCTNRSDGSIRTRATGDHLRIAPRGAAPM